MWTSWIGSTVLGDLLFVLIGCMIFVSIPKYYKDAHINMFLHHTASLWN